MPPKSRTDPRVANAFRAMRNLGITEEKVKPVLKNLLKIYEKNWELIEDENFRVLADAIFEQEEAQAPELKKKNEYTDQEKMDEEAQEHEEPERPLKRLRLRFQEDHVASSCGDSLPRFDGTSLKQPKVEEVEEFEIHPQQSGDMAESFLPNAENITGSHPLLLQVHVGNKGKQPVSPNSLSVQERFEPFQPTLAARIQPTTTRRIEYDSVSPSKKGKEILSSQFSSQREKPIIEMPSHAVHLTEPRIEPESFLLPKKWVHDSEALIKPKDEPFVDDMPHFEVPIAVIHPEDSGGGILELSGDRKTNCELANIVNESPSNLEIASSSHGEVKISLTYNSAHGGPDFRMPNIDALLKRVEDKCLKSYKVLDSSFSVKKVLEDICECFLQMRMDSANGSHEKIDVTSAVELLKQSNASLVPRLLSFSNGMDGLIKTSENITEDYCEFDKAESNLEEASSLSLVVVHEHQLTTDTVRYLHNVTDIAKAQERFAISVVNEVNDDYPPSFYYIPQNVVFQNAHVNVSLSRIGENCCSTCLGDCLSAETPCSCSHKTGSEFAYTSEGLVKDDFLEECLLMNRDPQKHCLFYCKECPQERSKNDAILEPCKGHLVRRFIKECWWKCGCSKFCGNRVVQQGINCKLQVFMTSEGKGWGLRTIEDLPKGAFVCEYVGEVLTNAELYERVSQRPYREEHSYPVLLDADWGSEGVLKDEEALCLDATYYGNVARFINHRCLDSNLIEIPVEVETPDHHYYHLAFFTTGKVKAMEELTWDYGIDFDDDDHPIKAFKCRCGSKFCRDIKHASTKSS
ncbi:Histone-lysine N-methyltransferase [Bertholletia excelsa]